MYPQLVKIPLFPNNEGKRAGQQDHDPGTDQEPSIYLVNSLYSKTFLLKECVCVCVCVCVNVEFWGFA